MKHHPATRIIAAVCNTTGLGFDAVCGRYGDRMSYHAESVDARAMAAHLMRKQGDTLHQIRDGLRMRSHSSALALLRRAERLIVESPEFGASVEHAHLLADVWAEAEPFVHHEPLRALRCDAPVSTFRDWRYSA